MSRTTFIAFPFSVNMTIGYLCLGMNCIVLVHFICHGFSYEKNMIVIIQRRQVVSADIG